MGRRKPTSGKARKVQLQTHRAIKSAKAEPTPHPQDAAQPQTIESLARDSAHGFSTLVNPGKGLPSSRKVLLHRPLQHYHTPEDEARNSRRDTQMKLESRFLRLPLDLLQHHRLVSATERLLRPIPPELGVLKVSELQPEGLQGLTCPKRPKWSYNNTKKEVEKNEDGMFKKWMQTTDEILDIWAKALPSTPAPSFYERNLQVWRQLWRVTEASEILLILIDVRFPLIHYPPSLKAYVTSIRPKKKVILVLTKTDLVPRWLAEAWKKWFEENETSTSGDSNVAVVMMESYREVERSETTQGTQPRYVPSAPPSSRAALLKALQRAHAELLVPPSIVADFPERLARWSPRVRKDVNWDIHDPSAYELNTDMDTGNTGVSATVKEKKSRRNKGKDIYVKRQSAADTAAAKLAAETDAQIHLSPSATAESPLPDRDRSQANECSEKTEGREEFPFLTIGLIGQPNVGKSSLLNALLGRKVVRASRTPGKTKTLQTIFWNSTIRLCDCPGLVCPSTAGMERQVLSGILPIQNVEPVLYFIAQRLPLEKVLALRHPDESEFDDFEGDEGDEIGSPTSIWTADELLSVYASSQGFITAKAGRPDLYRAGSFILRQLHSSNIPWGFRPPFTHDASSQGDQDGIFITAFTAKASSLRQLEREKRFVDSTKSSDAEETGEGQFTDDEGSEAEESEDSSASTSDDQISDDSDPEQVQNEKAFVAIQGAFASLNVEGESGEEDSDEGMKNSDSSTSSSQHQKEKQSSLT